MDVNFETAFYTTDDVAKILRVSNHTVRNLIDRGQLEAVRVGRVFRIRSDRFEHFLEVNTTASNVSASSGEVEIVQAEDNDE